MKLSTIFHEISKYFFQGSCQGRSDSLHQDERQDPGAGESEPHAAAGEGEGGGGGLPEAAQGEGRADQEAAESAHKQGRTHEEVDVENQVRRSNIYEFLERI